MSNSEDMAKKTYNENFENLTTIDCLSSNQGRAAHWKDVCNEYLETFCLKHEYHYEPDMWVGNDPGTIACVNDEMFVGMDTIRYDIDNNIPEKYFSKWYWKGLDVYEVTGEHYMNYQSYCKGAPDPWTNERLEELRESKNKIAKAQEEFQKMIDEYKKSNNNETGNF